MQVLLGHIVLSLNEPVVVASQKDAHPLALPLRLYYKRLGPLLVKLIFKGFGVVRKNPCLRVEVVLFGKSLLHHVQVSGQTVLPGKLVNCRQMVGSLVPLHAVEQSRDDDAVNPPDVPVFLLVAAESEVGLVGCVLEDLVLSVYYIYHQLSFFLFLVRIVLLPHQFPTAVVCYSYLQSFLHLTLLLVFLFVLTLFLTVRLHFALSVYWRQHAT